MNTENDDHSPGLRNPADGDPRRRREPFRKYMAPRLIDFVSRCSDFDELHASDVCKILGPDFIEAVDFLAVQCGFDSLEAAYEDFAHEPDNGDEDYEAATRDIELSASASLLSLAARKSMTRSSAICAPSRPRVSTNRTKLDPCGQLALHYKPSRPHVTI